MLLPEPRSGLIFGLHPTSTIAASGSTRRAPDWTMCRSASLAAPRSRYGPHGSMNSGSAHTGIVDETEPDHILDGGVPRPGQHSARTDRTGVIMSVPYVLFVATNAAVIGPNNRPTGFFFPEIAHPFESSTGPASPSSSPRRWAASPRGRVRRRRRRADRLPREQGLSTTVPQPQAVRVDVLDYDAVFFPGGLGPMVDITGNPEVQSTVIRAWNAGHDRLRRLPRPVGIPGRHPR